jgi:hypothetical protein
MEKKATLLINGITGTYSIPNVNKRAYKYRPFPPTLKFRVTTAPGQSTDITVEVKKKIDAAWRIVTSVAKNNNACNAYFKRLARGKTLQQVLEEGDIVLHCLEPKDGYTDADLPDANAAGRDIGIDPSLLAEKESKKLAGVLIHELAHVAGATTNALDENAIAAETALRHCGFEEYFNDKAVGARTGGLATSRLA